MSEVKVKKQIETQLPPNLRELALGALEACKDVRKYSIEQIHSFPYENFHFFIPSLEKNYKDHCDKLYYSTKCMYTFSPEHFLYP